MSLAWMYYLATIVGGLSNTFSFLFGVSVVLTLIGLIAVLVIHNDLRENTVAAWKRTIKISIPTGLVFLALTTLTPTKQDMLLIVGINIGEKGAAKVLEEAGEFYPLLKDAIKDQLSSLSKKQNKEKE